MMKKPISKSEDNRQKGKFQVEGQRENILDAAEVLFLQNGLEAVKMVDIAAMAGVTKVTLYRYFPNRDHIALELHMRMMKKIASLIPFDSLEPSLQSVKDIAHLMISNFDSLRDAYRFMGMFDSFYLDKPYEAELSRWTREQLVARSWEGGILNGIRQAPSESSQIIMVMSTVIWFVEKLALRGELTWSDPSVPLEVHLDLFDEMVSDYLEQVIKKK